MKKKIYSCFYTFQQAFFYRLKMIDMDDKFNSHIVKTDFEKKIRLITSPNASKGEMYFRPDRTITGISSIDKAGKLVR